MPISSYSNDCSIDFYVCQYVPSFVGLNGQCWKYWVPLFAMPNDFMWWECRVVLCEEWCELSNEVVVEGGRTSGVSEVKWHEWLWFWWLGTSPQFCLFDNNTRIGSERIGSIIPVDDVEVNAWYWAILEHLSCGRKPQLSEFSWWACSLLTIAFANWSSLDVCSCQFFKGHFFKGHFSKVHFRSK